MYLENLEIVNFKNLKSVKFNFKDGINTIIGENDSGKSNTMIALRILLDGSYYYNNKRLKESDFSDKLNNWKGHWIIISAKFGGITSEEKTNEVINEIIVDNENEKFLQSLMQCENNNFGTVTLFIRPQFSIRKALFEANNNCDGFNEILQNIRFADYEFYYTSRSQMDFINNDKYKTIVGDIDNCISSNPDEDDKSILGEKVDILEIWKYVSVVFIDALRDVESELRKSRNPIRRVIDVIQSKIEENDVKAIRESIRAVNTTLSNTEQIANVGNNINKKLIEVVGTIYSSNISLHSELKDDISTLSKYLTVTPEGKDNIELLGLGNLNILYIALKLVEFDYNKNSEVLNIMILEEPEAHVHIHIQKTLFENIKASKDYTQVLMTTHSTHLSEVSKIDRVNILKCQNDVSEVMQPTKGLADFGLNFFNNRNFINSLNRYLDAKRSILLFSKGVILVEGDGEEILIPSLVKKCLGVSLDELGIGLINIGNVFFENIACVFDDSRLRRHCSIITDADAIMEGASKSKNKAADLGESRKQKLSRLFDNNQYVDMFYANYTLEVDFAQEVENVEFIKEIIDETYTDNMYIEKYKNNISGSESEQYDTLLTVAKHVGKGWYATLLAEKINGSAKIPDYILDAIAFACKNTINLSTINKIINFWIKIDPKNMQSFDKEFKGIKQNSEIVINWLTSKEEEDNCIHFIKKVNQYD